VHEHRRRSFLGLVLMSTQAFFYNAIFFTYALVLMRFYSVREQNVGSYLFAVCAGKRARPAGARTSVRHNRRKKMITATYGSQAFYSLWPAGFFTRRCSTAQTQTVAWTIIFFIASAAASSAYLTVSEIFPLEIRAVAIAIFYAIGTLAGGVGAPILFDGSSAPGRSRRCSGVFGGAALMIFWGDH